MTARPAPGQQGLAYRLSGRWARASDIVKSELHSAMRELRRSLREWVSYDDALAISPLNAESLAEKREPTDGRRNLADRLLSLASVEFQDPAVRSVGTTANVARASLHPTP
jgi:hypothetical protein